MFFSIIIPTYNPSKFLPTLFNSILTNKCIDDMEIILSDDVSTEDFSNILINYPQLHFIQIANDKHYGYSREGRQNGANVATGKWITFIDQDDYLTDGALDWIKDFIENYDIHNFLSTDIQYISTEGNMMVYSSPWALTHGKFYEKTFWDKYQITYPNVQYCEDSNLCSMVECCIMNNSIQYTHINQITYVWVAREDSTSLSNRTKFFQDSFLDYMRGEVINFIDQYLLQEEISLELNNWYVETIIQQLIRVYFEFQLLFMKHIHYTDIPVYFLQMYNDAVEVFLQKIQLTRSEFIDLIEQDYLQYFNEIRGQLIADNLVFIETKSIRDWFIEISNFD